MHAFHLSGNFPVLKPLGARSNTIVVHVSIVLCIDENLKTLFERLSATKWIWTLHVCVSNPGGAGKGALPHPPEFPGL